MLQGWDRGVQGGSKTLVWGFAMAPHLLRILVLSFVIANVNWVFSILTNVYMGILVFILVFA